MSPSDPSLTLELFVRSLGPHEAKPEIDRLLTRIEQLVTSGVVSGYSLHVWGTRVCLSGPVAETSPGRFVADRLETFASWAAENGCTLHPFVERRTVHSSIIDESFREVVVPEVALGVFEGDHLRHFAPHASEDGVTLVRDVLSALEEGTFGGTIPTAASPE